jgi:hypothetical protein
MVMPPESPESSPPSVSSSVEDPPLDPEPDDELLPPPPDDVSSSSDSAAAVGDSDGVGVAIGSPVGSALSATDPHVAVAPEWPTKKVSVETLRAPTIDAAIARRTWVTGLSERVNSHRVTARATSPTDAGKRTSPRAACCPGFP